MNKRLAPAATTAEAFAIDLSGELQMQQFSRVARDVVEKTTMNVTVRVVADDAEAMEYSVIVLTRTGVILWSVRFAAAPLSVLLSAVDFAIAM